MKKKVFIDLEEINRAIEKIREEKKLKRKYGKDPYLKFRPYTAEIRTLAVTKFCSKRRIVEIMKSLYNVDFCPHKIYRFVCKINGGKWPRARQP